MALPYKIDRTTTILYVKTILIQKVRSTFAIEMALLYKIDRITTIV